MSTSNISGRQLKAARALLGWSQTDLARIADASRPTVERIESVGNGAIDYVRHDKAGAVIEALRGAGIDFVNGDRIGVTLRKAKRRR